MTETGSATSRFTRMVSLLALPLFTLTAAMQVRFAIMGDKGWLMLAANEWLSGKKLSVDIFEVNPPLIVWLYALPVWVSRHVEFLPDYAAMGCMGLLVLFAVAVLCKQLIERHPAFADDEDLRAQFIVLLLGVLLFTMSPVYFFDREDIMLMCAFPYVVRFMPSLARERYPLPLRLCTGALAAVGFFIKPHALFVFAALQLVYLVRERSPFILASVENIVIYLLGAAYLAAILYFTPDYITTVLPMAFAVYSSYNIKGAGRYHLTSAFLLAAIPLLDFRPRYVTPFRREVYYLMAVALIYLGYALLNNGWGYTYQPLFAVLAFLTGWLWWEYGWLKAQHTLRSLPAKQFDVGLKGCLYCLAICVIWGVFQLNALLAFPDCGGYSGCEANKPFVDAIAEKHIKSFGVMSGEFTRWPLIVRQSGASWDTRFNHLWMVPGLIHAQEEKDTSGKWAANQWIVTYVGRAFADDLARNKPDAMFIDASDEFFTYPPHPVDLLGLLKAVPEFKDAWRHYRFDSAINRCKSKDPKSVATVGCHYDIYLRKN